jgi:glycosyltransferase involved in cell wall biosynthesis
MNILKIHFDPPNKNYGTGRFIKEFSEKLIKLNNRVTNICCYRYEYEKFNNCKVILCNKLIKKRYPFITFIYELFYLEIYSLIYFIINKNKIDLIISYGDCGILVSFFSKLFKKPNVKYMFILYKDLVNAKIKEINKYRIKNENCKIFILKLLSFLEDNLRILLEKLILLTETNFITASKITKKHLKKKNVLINYYYHHFNNLPYVNKKKRNKLKKILLIGSDIYSKGIVKFLEIISLDKNFYKENTEIFIVGISDIKTFEKYVIKFGLSGIINYYGHEKNIKKFYKNVDIFINLSLIEGWGISLVDAYLKKIQIISTKVGVVREIFVDDKNVITCEKNNINDIDKKIKNLIISNQPFNNNLYKKASRLLDHSKIDNRYLNFINKLL